MSTNEDEVLPTAPPRLGSRDGFFQTPDPARMQRVRDVFENFIINHDELSQAEQNAAERYIRAAYNFVGNNNNFENALQRRVEILEEQHNKTSEEVKMNI